MISELFPNWRNCERHGSDITIILKNWLLIYKLRVAQLIIKFSFTLIEIDIVFVIVKYLFPFRLQ
jgi:hypothetical protein